MKLLVRGIFALVFCSFPLVLFATDNQDLIDLRSAITLDARYIVKIIDQIMVVLMVGGVIYVAATLISEKAVNKSVISAWFVALIIWLLSKIIFGLDTVVTN